MPSEQSVFGPVSELGTFCMQCSISDYPTTSAHSKSHYNSPTRNSAAGSTVGFTQWLTLTSIPHDFTPSRPCLAVLFGVSEIAASNWEYICGGSHDNVLRDETQTWLLTFLSWTCLVYWRQHPWVCWIDNAASCGSHGFVNCLVCTVANISLRNIGRKNCRREQ